MQQEFSAQAIMRQFAVATGLSGNENEARRYLWTDAWAVCNYLGFYRQTSEQSFLDLALKLVDQVHENLGKHREDSTRSGWLSGLPEAEARLHPTLGGLRIGKRFNERQPGERPEETLEWQQDGQYFHYLTRWMHALDCVSTTTGRAVFNHWARELARVAHRAFVYASGNGGRKRMYWKMSIDLSRPLVDSMGHHDPLDGLLICQQLEATAKRLDPEPSGVRPELSLTAEIDDFAALCEGGHWATEDELGIGSLLGDSYKLVQLIASGSLMDTGLLEVLLAEVESSLVGFAARNRLGYPAEYRLAFRELGLATGLSAIDKIHHGIKSQPDQFRNAARLSARSERLLRFSRLHGTIVNYWLEAEHRGAGNWREHADINNVMLATSLDPEGYLHLPMA